MLRPQEAPTSTYAASDLICREPINPCQVTKVDSVSLSVSLARYDAAHTKQQPPACVQQPPCSPPPEVAGPLHLCWDRVLVETNTAVVETDTAVLAADIGKYAEVVMLCSQDAPTSSHAAYYSGLFDHGRPSCAVMGPV